VTRRDLPTRYWFEVVTAAIGAVLFVLTLVTREWIEILTGWDPDGGSGALELAIAIGLLAAAVISAVAARRDYVAAATT
jgi:hypothetical protein